MEKQFTHFCAENPLYICEETVFTPKNSSYSFQVYKNNGRSLINLVHQYPALWDKQDAKYKDSNYKNAKWKEIAKFYALQRKM